MPRIVPLQLLKCLRVLLDDNGGILGATEVPRIAGLMTKYSKKLVSKCIYVQILKSTKTELLGEFMAVGGWSLTYTWLNDAIRAMNWPLVQEILELLLLSPVDVNRLKINSAPKLVKGLCKDGGNEGVRILAKRLVEQWLKIVTGQSGGILPVVGQTAQQNSLTQSTAGKAVTNSSEHQATMRKEDSDGTEEQQLEDAGSESADMQNTLNYTMTSAQRKADNQAGLVFKFVVSDGQQTLKPVEKQSNDANSSFVNANNDEMVTDNANHSEVDGNVGTIVECVDRKGDGGEGKSPKTIDDSLDKKHKSSRDKDKKSSEKERDKDKKSSSHRSSSSSHKSSSSKSSSSSSKSSSSSSSHRRSSDKRDRDSSSKDKDKDRKEGSSSSSSSSSSKHKSKSSSSSSSKDRSRDKDKEKSQSSSKKDKEQSSEHDKDNKMMPPPTNADKKAKEDAESQKPKSILIPNRKASISIEIRRDVDKAKTVKTYNSQFRSHGLTEEAPRPPSRKDLKKPGSTQSSIVGPTASLKRVSPPPKEVVSEKKPKIDMCQVNGVIDKPGAIKLIPPKKIQTLVETNLFSDALAASIEPKKVKRKRPPVSPTSKDVPTSPDAPKLTPLKFYQDTLDESKADQKHEEKDDSSKENDSTEESPEKQNIEDDDDLPLKKVKEDIEQRVQKEKSLLDEKANNADDKQEEDDVVAVDEVRKPGPGCGPDGPPGVLMLHRRKGPKKKLTWQPEDKLTQVRYFEVDHSERVNVTKQSFLEMKNMERFGERDAMNSARRGLDDTMEPQTEWRPLIEVENVQPHPNGSQSKQRAEQAAREMTTLRALYFTHQLIPDSPAEAEIEPHYAHDIPVIPLEDLTGNPDAINDFTTTPWPEAKGMAPSSETLLGPINDVSDVIVNTPGPPEPNMVNNNPFSPFGNSFDINAGNMPVPQPMPMNMQGAPPPGIWANQPMVGPPGPMMNSGVVGVGNPFGSPNMDMNPGVGNIMNGPPQNFVNGPFNNPQFNMNGPPPFGGPVQPGFNGMNFGPMGGGPNMMNNMNGPGPMMPGQRNNNRNNNGGGGGGWRSGGNNFQDNGGNWRPAGSGPNGRGGGGGGGNGNNNTGICKAFMRGHCRLGKSCKYVHPQKKRM